MIAIFRETWASVRNFDYGEEIVKKTVGQAFWYWFKYLILISLVLMGLVIATLTYFTPQIPKLVEKVVPDVSVAIKDGQLSTNATQPLVLSRDGFTFMLNTQGTAEDIDKIDAGILVLKDKLIFKDQTQTKTMDLSEITDEIKLDKPTLINWLQTNRLTILTIGITAVVVLTILALGFYTLWQALVFIFGALLLWVVAQVLKRKVNYADSLKLTIYAAVPALIASILFSLSPNQAGSTISLAVWAVFGIAWVYHLPVAKAK